MATVGVKGLTVHIVVVYVFTFCCNATIRGEIKIIIKILLSLVKCIVPMGRDDKSPPIAEVNKL